MNRNSGRHNIINNITNTNNINNNNNNNRNRRISIGTNNNNNVNNNNYTENLDTSFELLPKQFVSAMRTLFNIMDDKGTGFVKLSDIEDRWLDDGSKDIPRGVIDSLKKVTPNDGLLSFERFCTGLKICLIRNKNDVNNNYNENNKSCNNAAINKCGKNMKQHLEQQHHRIQQKQQRSPSVPLLDLENAIPIPQWNGNNTATVRPNNATISVVQRTLSLPKLSPDSEIELYTEQQHHQHHLHKQQQQQQQQHNMYAPPPKPPRTGLVLPNTTNVNNNNNNNNNNIDRSSIDKAEIRYALQNWQMGILMNEMDAKEKNSSVIGDEQHTHNINCVSTGSVSGGGVYQKKNNIRRREPRRHTLQNGIDYNLLKKLKQLEQEKDVLLQGLNAIEKAQEWYLKQISIVQDKMKCLGSVGSYVEQWSEAHQERLDLQRARVMEVNRHLTTLADSWERGGFPLHMNLAVRYPSGNGFNNNNNNKNNNINRTKNDNDNNSNSNVNSNNNNTNNIDNNNDNNKNDNKNNITNNNNNNIGQQSQFQNELVNRLKQQNRQLTDEVSKKSERITVMELERQTLIREVVQLQRNNFNLSSNEEVIF